MGFLDVLSAPFKLAAKGVGAVFNAGKDLVHDVVQVPISLVHDVTSVPIALVHEGAGVVKGGQHLVDSLGHDASDSVNHVADSAQKLGSDLGKSLSMPLLIGGAGILLLALNQRK